ncbi:MAG: hypothetical protein ABIH11_00595 [Candidatus Altiarchaeota archaeon]
MEHETLTAFFFVLGILTESVIMVRKSGKWGEFISIIILSAITSFFVFADNTNVNIIFPAMAGIIAYAWMFATVFRKDMLPVITEEVILSHTILFWFLAFGVLRRFYFLRAMDNILLLALIPTAGALWISFTDRRLDFWGKAFFYSWFLLTSVIFMAYYFIGGVVSVAYEYIAGSLSVFDSFFMGIVFLHLIANIAYVFELIPIPGKHETMEHRMREWFGYCKVLVGKYSDRQMKPFHAMMIMIFQGGSLLANMHFRFASDFLLFNLWILAIPLISKPDAIKPVDKG